MYNQLSYSHQPLHEIQVQSQIHTVRPSSKKISLYRPKRNNLNKVNYRTATQNFVNSHYHGNYEGCKKDNQKDSNNILGFKKQSSKKPFKNQTNIFFSEKQYQVTKKRITSLKNNRSNKHANFTNSKNSSVFNQIKQKIGKLSQSGQKYEQNITQMYQNQYFASERPKYTKNSLKKLTFNNNKHQKKKIEPKKQKRNENKSQRIPNKQSQNKQNLTFNYQTMIKRKRKHKKNNSDLVSFKNKQFCELYQAENKQQIHGNTKNIQLRHSIGHYNLIDVKLINENKNVQLENISMRKQSAKQIILSKKYFSIQDFELGLRKSQDSFGVLYPARHLITGFILCIKVVHKKHISKDLQKFINCYKFQNYVSSPKTVQIYGIFQENDKIYVLMQYFEDGGFYLKIRTAKCISSLNYLNYFKDISQGLKQFHDKGKLNLKICSDKISYLLDVCKISNFTENCDENKMSLSSIKNCLEYCAPEILYGQKFTKNSQMWNLGILFFQILTGNTPFSNLSRKRILKKIEQSNNLIDLIDSKLQIPIFLKSLLQKNAQNRLTIDNILEKIQQQIASQNLSIINF